MYFDIAGISVHPLIPPLVAFFISLFASTGGVSGAFLILPFQLSILGFTTPAVSATNHLYNVVAIPSGVYRYIKEGRMVWPLTNIVITGTIPGVFIGTYIRVAYLPDPVYFKIFAGFVLLYMGYRLIQDLLKRKIPNGNSAEEKFQELVNSFKDTSIKQTLPRTKVRKFNLKILIYEFYGEEFKIPTMKIFLISCIVGLAGGIYGIGGGAIMSPIYVAFFGLPVYTVAGAALMGTLITSFVGVIFYVILSGFYPEMHIQPDWMLGVLFGLGGLVGMYVGAGLQKRMPAKLIKWLLAAMIMFISISYLSGIFKLF